MEGEDPETDVLKTILPKGSQGYANPRLKTTDLYNKLRIVPGTYDMFRKYELWFYYYCIYK